MMFCVMAISGLVAKGQGHSAQEVADMTIKVGIKHEEELYYGFEAGDEIIFSLEVQDGQKAAEVEIVAYPEQSKFKDLNVERITEKRIKVRERGVYEFRVRNSGWTKAIVAKVHIQRMPQSAETIDFNTGVVWVEEADTTYKIKEKNVVVGYNNYEVEKTRRVVDRVDTNFVMVLDRVERVHSNTALNGASNVSNIVIALPENKTTYGDGYKVETRTRVLNWVYLLRVNSPEYDEWQAQANKEAKATLASVAGSAATYLGGPQVALALLAFRGVSAYRQEPQGDNVWYWVTANINNQNYTLAKGNSVAAVGREDRYTQGSYLLTLQNDNIMNGINVKVQVCALVATEHYKDEVYKEQKSEKIKERQIVKDPKIKMRKVPMLEADL